MSSETKGAAGFGATIFGGGLPRQAPERMWGGSGSGVNCAICGQRIGVDQLEYELEFGGSGSGRASYHVHVRCCSQWERERNAVRLSEVEG